MRVKDLENFRGLRTRALTKRKRTLEFSMATLCRIEENLSAAHLRLSGAYVENLSWQDCMKRYDRDHTFFYCDPPYWQTEGYGVDFDFEQYEQMAEFMRNCKGKVMISPLSRVCNSLVNCASSVGDKAAPLLFCDFNHVRTESA